MHKSTKIMKMPSTTMRIIVRHEHIPVPIFMEHLKSSFKRYQVDRYKNMMEKQRLYNLHYIKDHCTESHKCLAG